MIGKRGQCVECVTEGDEKEKFLPKPSKMLCTQHNSKRLEGVRGKKLRTPIRPVGINRADIKKKDREFFKEIWDSRPHFSEVSGKPLNYEFSPAMFFCFSHVASKGAYPSLRHWKYNIVLTTREEHQEWEFMSRKGLGPEFDFKKKMLEHCIQSYYKSYKI